MSLTNLRDPLPNIVCLKLLLAYPQYSRVNRVSDATGAAVFHDVNSILPSWNLDCTRD
jgi:hypothetical protein